MKKCVVSIICCSAVQFSFHSATINLKKIKLLGHWQELSITEIIIYFITVRCICISAVYAGRRCLSVCVMFVSCAKTNKDIFEIFSRSGSQAILVFPYQTGWRYSDGNPTNGGVKCKGVWKNDDFLPIYRSISETVIVLVRWAHSARQFVSIELPFHPYNI